ncbi:GNAT family N-acetyltransferase [Tepidimicrobium xylanilyticum]
MGLLDIEYVIEKGTVCYYTHELGGVIWHFVVLPEFRNTGIAIQLLSKAIDFLREKVIKRSRHGQGMIKG